jgi:hypothetical protein
MKKLNKIILLSALSALGISSTLAAATAAPLTDSSKYLFATESYEAPSSHRYAMGSAGLGVTGFYDSYLYNPANISKSGFQLLTPTLTFSINNVQSLIDPDDPSQDGLFELFDRSSNGDDISGDMVDLLLDSVNEGYGEISTANLRTGFKTRMFGFNLDVQNKIRSNNFGLSSTSATYLDQVDIVATGAFGFNIPVSNKFSLDLGASLSFNYRVYSQALGAVDAANLANDFSMDDLSQTIPVASGYAIPITLGANLNMPLGFIYSAVVRNLNDTYHFTSYYSLENMINFDPTITSIIGEETSLYTGSDATIAANVNTEPEASSSYDIENDWTLDMGLTWDPGFTFLKPVVALDVKDVLNVFDDSSSSDFTTDLLASINVGAQISLLDILDLRAGLSSGYKSVGVGIDILPWLLHLDAAYYFKEFGTVLGSTPSDVLSFRFSLLSAK